MEAIDKEILIAKSALYNILLKKGNEKLTDNETDIILLLSQDEQIQLIFEKNKK